VTSWADKDAVEKFPDWVEDLLYSGRLAKFAPMHRA
jgi:hypothetical protein